MRLSCLCPSDSAVVPTLAADLALNVFYTVEMGLRIVSLGPPWVLSYLRSPWNAFDAFMLLVGYTMFLPASVTGGNTAGIRALRAMRALRPLRTIARFQALRSIIVCLLEVRTHAASSLVGHSQPLKGENNPVSGSLDRHNAVPVLSAGHTALVRCHGASLGAATAVRGSCRPNVHKRVPQRMRCSGPTNRPGERITPSSRSHASSTCQRVRISCKPAIRLCGCHESRAVATGVTAASDG